MPPRNRSNKPRKVVRKARLSKAVTKAVKKIVIDTAGTPEQKYVADQEREALNVPVSVAIPSSLVSALPPLSEGMGSYQRVGQRVSKVRGATHFSFSLNNAYLGSANWAVRVYMLTSKQVKSYTKISSLSAGSLLDRGDGTTNDWNPAGSNIVLLSQLPLARENFSGSYKEFKFAKNSGGMNNDTSTPPPSSNGGCYSTNHQFTWHWKHKQIKYDETLETRPTQYNPMFLIVAYVYDNYDISADGFICPVIATIRRDMYFVDN